MKRILTFIDAWGVRLITPLVLIIFLKTCTTNTKVSHVEKDVAIAGRTITQTVSSANRTNNRLKGKERIL